MKKLSVSPLTIIALLTSSLCLTLSIGFNNHLGMFVSFAYMISSWTQGLLDIRRWEKANGWKMEL